jgi:hypothetical protein
MRASSNYIGDIVAFAPVNPEDEFLHPVPADAHHTSVETNLYGFNIPEEDIQCNIYILWHPVLETMSAHIFVYRGARVLQHQLCANYFNEHLYLPAVADNSDYRLKMGTCSAHIQVLVPLQEVRLEFDDPAQDFSLTLRMRAALPPVGRPGGKHFTQLMHTSGSLQLEGQQSTIAGYYMRDRSWGYCRPEEPECMPPYRWMTGWLGQETGFVVAWLDTGMLDEERFGPRWHEAAAMESGAADNKWESGGATPSTNLRSGWIAVAGDIRQVVTMEVNTLFGGGPRFLARSIALTLGDSAGDTHVITGHTVSMIPKMYWQNMLTNMHFMQLSCGDRQGHGDLMDTYSSWHIKPFGL